MAKKHTTDGFYSTSRVIVDSKGWVDDLNKKTAHHAADAMKITNETVKNIAEATADAEAAIESYLTALNKENGVIAAAKRIQSLSGAPESSTVTTDGPSLRTVEEVIASVKNEAVTHSGGQRTDGVDTGVILQHVGETGNTMTDDRASSLRDLTGAEHVVAGLRSAKPRRTSTIGSGHDLRKDHPERHGTAEVFPPASSAGSERGTTNNDFDVAESATDLHDRNGQAAGDVSPAQSISLDSLEQNADHTQLSKTGTNVPARRIVLDGRQHGMIHDFGGVDGSSGHAWVRAPVLLLLLLGAVTSLDVLCAV
ncbi:hypothetical protein DQ04_16831000 [Trypanosoma grayi]|uniref:hypothetical protein n=1 Tax=Trypanosoma grayi TaxID=71804 RepID=UPI0004F48D5E|nr:hypothetical protein DQ04_16831000 [Trypanosoma grayi]KEG05982.1 hypothetical protein DQ04_16831000 [Trypanosoma grayi]